MWANAVSGEAEVWGRTGAEGEVKVRHAPDEMIGVGRRVWVYVRLDNIRGVRERL